MIKHSEALYVRFGKTNVNQKRVAPDDIVEATETFIDRYNNTRPKEALCGLSPVEFREMNPKRNMADGCGLSFSVDSWLEEGYKPECYQTLKQ